jgi:hypothetical protein
MGFSWLQARIGVKIVLSAAVERNRPSSQNARVANSKMQCDSLHFEDGSLRCVGISDDRGEWWRRARV